MSEETNGHDCGPDEVWDEESGQCIPKPSPPAEGKDLTFSARMKMFFDDYFKQLEANLSKTIDAKVAKIVKEKEVQIEHMLRKEFGVVKDPVVHLSDIPNIIRKLQLENAEGGKQTPASPDQEVGPAGNKPLLKTLKARPDLDAVFKRYGLKGDN